MGEEHWCADALTQDIEFSQARESVALGPSNHHLKHCAIEAAANRDVGVEAEPDETSIKNSHLVRY
ncbi:hypothetical protein ACNI3K_12065 [Demequina sp. SO4-13]|uniref:hypothetical protein n=1 Tax=Demequina sp. SO4-13 TaxID=3401027 RepID=UPI003AF923E5